MVAKFYKKLFYSASIIALSALSPALSLAELPISTISNTMYNPDLSGVTAIASIGTVITSDSTSNLPITVNASPSLYNINMGSGTIHQPQLAHYL